MAKIRLLLSLMLGFFVIPSFGQSTVERSGDFLAGGLPFAAGLSSLLILEDSDAMINDGIACATTLYATHVLKAYIDKTRPNGDEWSFPSGHTSMAFTGAGIIERRYGWKYGIPAYVLAAYTGYTRIDANKHDIWDVLGGAGIGIASAYLFTQDQEKINGSIGVIGNTPTLGFVLRF